MSSFGGRLALGLLLLQAKRSGDKARIKDLEKKLDAAKKAKANAARKG